MNTAFVTFAWKSLLQQPSEALLPSVKLLLVTDNSLDVGERQCAGDISLLDALLVEGVGE